MIYRYPEYCEKFRCIADKCRDSCCIGWEIDIDPETLVYYGSIGGGFGERLRRGISGGAFVLGEDERCPFLNSKGLCDIYTELGEEHLCRICSDHPRYFEWFEGVKEGGVGLSCEAAAELIISSDFRLKEKEVPEEAAPGHSPELYSLLLSAREEMLRRLETDELRSALRWMLAWAEELQSRMDNGELTLPEDAGEQEASAPDAKRVLEYFRGLETLDPCWPELLKTVEEQTGAAPLTYEQEVSLRRIGAYFLYRYFMKGVFDGEILSRVKLAAVSVWVIGWLWRTTGTGGTADIPRRYSKEIEYCEENIEAFLDSTYEEDFFTSAGIAGLLSIL